MCQSVPGFEEALAKDDAAMQLLLDRDGHNARSPYDPVHAFLRGIIVPLEKCLNYLRGMHCIVIDSLDEAGTLPPGAGPPVSKLIGNPTILAKLPTCLRIVW